MKSAILKPLSFVYGAATKLRNELYERGLLKIHNFNVAIVSVGNLTMGGTGKTPIICELLRWATENKLRPAMISRGYKGTFDGIQRVPPDGDPQVFGDEPVMVAKRFPQVPVYVGADRVAVVEEVLSKENVNVIFADDAFQHRRLGRRIDIVILDCTEKIENYRLLPEGRGRESYAALRRADFIILNKANLVTPDHKKQMLEFIDTVLAGKNTPVIESDYYIGHIENLQTGEKETAVGYQSVVLASAIGNPKAFEFLVKQNFNVLKHFIYRDHYNFNQDDLNKIRAEARIKKAQRILVTEKDAIKIKRMAPQDFSVAVLAPKLSLKAKKIYESVLENVR